MDRREALKRLSGVGVVVAGASLVQTSPAFADSGTVNCRPTNIPATSNTLTPSTTGLGGSAIKVTSSVSSFTLATCPSCGGTPTSSVQYRWTTSAPAGYSIFASASGGSPLSGFTPAMVNPVYVRPTGGGPIPEWTPLTFTVRLTARWVCTTGSRRAWRCRAWVGTFSYVSFGGDGFVWGISTTSADGNSSACDSPAP